MSSLLTLDGYQNLAAKTAVYPGQGSYLGLIYVTGKLNGEAGETAEIVFKGLRDGSTVSDVEKLEINPIFPMDIVNVTFGWVDGQRRQKLKKELGDVLWYIAMAAKELGYTLGEVAEENVAKLTDRQSRDVLNGDGDNR